MTKISTLLGLLLFALAGRAQPELSFSQLAVTFDKPLDLTSAGDETEEIYIAQKDGEVFRYDLNSGDTSLFLDLSDRLLTVSEGGLLAMAFHPAYPDSNYFYVSFTEPGNTLETPMVTVLSRFSVDPSAVIDPSSERVILRVLKPGVSQNGGGLGFGPDGYLYFGLGDGGGRMDEFENGQNPMSMLGKMLRMDVDRTSDGKQYAIPPDNPFVGTLDTLDEIWSLGLRNPFRFSFDRMTGDLWISDKGDAFWEEINFQAAGSGGGQNYGWNCREGFEKYSSLSTRYCGDEAQPFDSPPDRIPPQFTGRLQWRIRYRRVRLSRAGKRVAGLLHIQRFLRPARFPLRSGLAGGGLGDRSGKYADAKCDQFRTG